ncbi:MAG: 50S ribosomal protein L21 [Cytophagales bacterium]
MSSPLAVIARDGKQFAVTEGQKLLIRKRADEQLGSAVVFDKVLLFKTDDTIEVGTPTVDGVTVVAIVIDFFKTKKVMVFKKKCRKGYQVKNGHRECYVYVEIQEIKKK